MEGRLSLFSSAYYAANAVYQGFITVYLGAAGLGEGQIGLVMGTVPLLSMLTQPAWGALCDRVKHKGRLLCLMAALAAFSLLLMPLGNTFGWLLTVNSLFSAFFTALQPLGDAQILAALGSQGNYGRVRLWASLAFALASLAAGYAFRGRLSLLMPMAAALLAATAAAALTLPAGRQSVRAGKGLKGLQVLKVPGLLPMLLLAGLLQATMGYFYSFFPVRFLQLPGSQEGLLGVCYLIASLSEIPFLLFFDRLFRRLGALWLLILSALLLAARYLILGLNGALIWMMASQALSGLGIIALTATMAREVARRVPQGLGARGQALYSAISYALARVAGNLAGGQVAQRLGIPAGFGLMAALALAAGLGFAVMLMAAPAPDRPAARN